MKKTRIDLAFDRLRKEKKKGFVAYITAGDPSLKATVDMTCRLADIGVDIIELGIPFSDPLADGQVNHQSATRALAAGVTVEGVFKCIEQIRKKCDVPIVLYAYLNLLVAPGFDRSVKRIAKCGADGVLILDLPAEEMADYGPAIEKAGLNNICLVTPTSPAARIKKIVKGANGFVYCVSRTGVTGMQNKLGQGGSDVVRATKRHTKLPVALGFGISSPEQARTAAKHADAIVVGSAIVSRLHEAPRTAEGRAKVARWVKTLVKAAKEN